jgi:dipeptide/tripeptide permease
MSELARSRGPLRPTPQAGSLQLQLKKQTVPIRAEIRLFNMGKLGAFVGSTIGSYAGWYLGARIGFTTAFIVSMVGMGIGLYYGRKIALSYVE